MTAGARADGVRPLRIAFVIATLDQAGAEKQLTLLATNLPREEFEPHVVALHRGGHFEAALREAGVPVHIIGKRWKFDPGTFRRLRAALRAIDPDVIHSWMFTANAHVRLLHDGRWQRPWIVISERSRADLKTPWQRWLDRLLVGRASRVVVNGRALVEEARATGFEPERIELIPNAVEGIAARRGARANASEGEFRIAYVGRLSPEKRVDVLIEAARQLVSDGFPVCLDLIGDGPERFSLEQAVPHSAAAARIHFCGHHPRASAVLPEYDAFWLGSDSEGSSNSLLEAMATGLPVVATAIPANREVIRDGETGLLFAPGDPASLAAATRGLIADPVRAAQLGRQAAAAIQGTSGVESMGARYATIFRSLVGGANL